MRACVEERSVLAWNKSINGFNPNEESSHFHICDHLIVAFGIRKKLGFSNTSHVDSLDRFRRSVVDQVKTDICIKKIKSFKSK